MTKLPGQVLDRVPRVFCAYVLPKLATVLFALSFLVLILPLAYLLALSFTDTDTLTMNGSFVGLRNFQRVVQDDTFWLAGWRGVLFAAATAAAQVALGLFLAVKLTRPFPGRRLVFALLLLPYAVPIVAMSAIWRWMLDGQHGIISYFMRVLHVFGANTDILNSPTTALAGVIAANIWYFYPFVLLFIAARLSQIPAAQFELAETEGVPRRRQFWTITLPHLAKTLGFLFVLRFLWMFNKFDSVWLLTRGGPIGTTENIPVLVYRECFHALRLGRAAATVVLAVLFLAILAITYRLSSPLRAVVFRRGLCWCRRIAAIARSRIRIRSQLRTTSFALWMRRQVRPSPSLLFAAVVLVFPLLWTLVSAFRPLDDLFQQPPSLIPRYATILNFSELVAKTDFVRQLLVSCLVATVSAILSPAAALGCVYVLRRAPPLVSRLARPLSLSLYAVPPLASVIPLFVLFARFHMTDSLLGLSLAILTISLPFNIWFLLAQLRSLDAHYEEAAILDGVSAYRRFVDIVLPAIRPSIVACCLFTFLLAFNDYLFAVVFLHSADRLTVSVGMANFVEASAVHWGHLTSAVVAVSTPMIILLLLGYRFLGERFVGVSVASSVGGNK